MPIYSPTAWERAMKLHEVLAQAIAGKITWLQASDRMGCSPRTMRRWRGRMEKYGIEGLKDRRMLSPSGKAIQPSELAKWLKLYRTRYRGYNARHFWSTCRRQHGLTWSYTLIREALQRSGLVRRHRPRGRHFRRREPRGSFGEMLHVDGSRHRWLALRPEESQSLIVVVDDATRKILYAQLTDHESTHSVFEALGAVLTQHGIPQALYTDRASWAAVTRKAGQPVDKNYLTQVGRALKKLGIEHILAYSPQARGRSERVNRTLQGRLVNELSAARIRSIESANRYLNEQFLPAYNIEFSRPPAEVASAFVALGTVPLESILCWEEERCVARDNTVQLDAVRMQIDKQPGRATCAGLTVSLRRHLDGTHTVIWGKRVLGRYDARGKRLETASVLTPEAAA